MRLIETTFDEFLNWCQENKKHWSTERQYITVPKLRIIYIFCANHDMRCEGQRCRVTWKGNEFISQWSEPLDHKANRDDWVWSLFHEVWCKAEWAIRCGRDPQELGYESVKSEFGIRIIKELKEAA